MLGSQGRAMPTPSYMSEDQMGQQSRASPSIQARRALFGGSRSEECSTIQEEDSQSVPAASYLKDLRANKTRPIGSRPPPPSKFGSLRRTETEKTNTPSVTDNGRPPLPQSNSMPTMPAQTMARRGLSTAGRNSPFAGRPLARTPSANPSIAEKEEEKSEELPNSRPRSAVYMEQGSRWMEKQEAQSLLMALEDMDIAEEQRIHKDAQDEAAELVWKHRNPDSPFANPEAPYMNPDLNKDYRSHLRKGSYSRSHSREAMPQASNSPRSSFSSGPRPSLETSNASKKSSLPSPTRTREIPEAPSDQQRRTPSGKNYGELAAAVKKDIDTARRRTSSGSRRVLSGEKKVFMHPDDKIYEDPQEEPTAPKKQQPPPPLPVPDLRPAPVPAQSSPSLIRKNPFARVRHPDTHASCCQCLSIAMSDHIRDAPPDGGRDALASFSYPWAGAPDMIRSHQKDAYFQSHLLHQLSNILRSLYGARLSHAWANEARTFTELLYLALTTFVGNRTLGEEYTDIVQVQDDTHQLPSIARRTSYILSSVLTPYLLSRLLPALRRRLRAKLEVNVRKSHQRRASSPTRSQQPTPKTAQLQQYILKNLDSLTSPSLIYAVSLATFYFTGAYYELSKRLTGLRYVFTRKVEPSDQRVGYEVLGVLLVLQMMVQGYFHAQEAVRDVQSAQQPLPASSTADESAIADDESLPGFSSPLLFEASHATDPAAQREHLARITHTPMPSGAAGQHRYDLNDDESMMWIDGKQQRKCTLCLEAMKDPAATTCGHVFCWQCVNEWLREQPMCPLCRQSALVQHVLPLQG